MQTKENWHHLQRQTGLPGGASGKEPPTNAGDGDPGSSLGGNGEEGSPLQYSCPENPLNPGAWWAAVHWVTKRWTPLTRTYHALTEIGLDQSLCAIVLVSKEWVDFHTKKGKEYRQQEELAEQGSLKWLDPSVPGRMYVGPYILFPKYACSCSPLHLETNHVFRRDVLV